MDNNINTVAFIKKMLRLGYSQKQVSMMTKEHPSKIQRITAKKTYQYVDPNSYIENEFFELNKRTLDRILSFPEIAGHGHLTEQDKNYIRLIKYCGGEYRGVRWLYADRPHWQIRQIWLSGEPFKPQEFDALQIGIKNKELYFLLA